MRFLAFAVCSLAAVTNESVKFQFYREVSPRAHELIRQLAGNLTFEDDIASLIGLVYEENCEKHLLKLTGENSTQITRVSDSIKNPDGIIAAANYVQSQMEAFGFSVELNTWDPNRGPNVISTLRGSVAPLELVILGAHLDDIPSSGRAPGANDDGSGSAALLCMAEAIKQFRDTTKIEFERTIIFEHYTGEEQGLLGSRAQSKLRASRMDFVAAMIQTDMTALKLAGDPMGLALVNDPRATDPELTQLVKDLAQTYKDPQLTVYDKVLSGSSCCSDHQSYKEQGFASAGLIEPRGYTGDPQYHKVGDVATRADYSTLQLTLAARVMLASGASIAKLNTNALSLVH